MAIIDVGELWKGRTGSIDEKAVRRYTRLFRVRTSSPYSGPIEVRQAAGIPRMFQPYILTSGPGESDTAAVVVNIDPQQNEASPYEWEVRIEYSTAPSVDPEDPASLSENPLDQPPKISWTGQDVQIAVDKDLDQVLVATSAWEPYESGYLMTIPLQKLRIVRNEPEFDPEEANQYRNSVNDAQWYQFPADTVLCTVYDGETAYSGGLAYWIVTREFLIKYYLIEGTDELDPNAVFEKWIPTRLLDQGNYVTDFSNGNRKQPLDQRGMPISGAVLLDGAGSELDTGTDPVYNEFRFHRRKNFAALNLP